MQGGDENFRLSPDLIPLLPYFQMLFSLCTDSNFSGRILGEFSGEKLVTGPPQSGRMSVPGTEQIQPKKESHSASIPPKNFQEVKEQLCKLFGLKCDPSAFSLGSSAEKK